MNYEDMSDFEINKWIWRLTMNGKTMHCHGTTIYKESTRYNEFDPCNNPSDAWPIIVENNISISHSIALYRADALVYDNKFDKGFKIFKQDSQLGDTSSRGALRAVMICFLKMKDAENGC